MRNKRMRNEELGIRNGGMLFYKKLLSNKSVAKQRIPKLFTIHYSLFTALTRGGTPC